MYAHFPIADIVFRHEINSEFIIHRTLKLSVVDPRFKDYPDQRSVHNPKDGTKISLAHRTHLSVRLPYKWKRESRGGLEYIEWRCVEAPPWLHRLDYADDTQNEQEIFNFVAELDVGHMKSTGTLVFDCGHGYLCKNLTVVCIRPQVRAST